MGEFMLAAALLSPFVALGVFAVWAGLTQDRNED